MPGKTKSMNLKKNKKTHTIYDQGISMASVLSSDPYSYARWRAVVPWMVLRDTSAPFLTNFRTIQGSGVLTHAHIKAVCPILSCVSR